MSEFSVHIIMMANITLRLRKACASRTANWFNIRIMSMHDSAILNNKEAQVNSADENDVLLTNIKGKGIITLNRPEALNCLNMSMVQKIYATLKEWKSSMELIIIRGTGQKAFCSGGDIKSIFIAINKSGDEKFGRDFLRRQYTLNHLIGTYKRPYIAILNGITMGGGVGLSVHGQYRIATENTLFAMPETAIGLVPDVGGTFFLPRLKGKLGYYLGLTGHRLRGTDVLMTGIATHYVPSERLEDLTNELLELNNEDINAAINKYQPDNFNPDFTLKPYSEQIDNCFSAPTVEEIIRRLESDGSEWAVRTLQLLEKMSPTSLTVTLRALQTGAQQSLAECLKMEFRLNLMSKDSDVYEGVRALLIDKDQKPVWKPSRLSEISEEDITARFNKLPAGEELEL